MLAKLFPMSDKDLYAQILGIQCPWMVREVALNLDEGEVVVHVNHDSQVPLTCPDYGKEYLVTTPESVVGGTWTPASTARSWPRKFLWLQNPENMKAAVWAALEMLRGRVLRATRVWGDQASSVGIITAIALKVANAGAESLNARELCYPHETRKARKERKGNARIYKRRTKV